MVDEHRLFLEQKKALADGNDLVTKRRATRGSARRSRGSNESPHANTPQQGRRETSESQIPNSGGPPLVRREPSAGLVSRCSNVREIPQVIAEDMRQSIPESSAEQYPSSTLPPNSEQFSPSVFLDDEDQGMTALEAVRVKSEKQFAMASAEVDSFFASLKRSRSAQLGLICCGLVVIALVVVFSVMLTNDSNKGDDSSVDKFFNTIGNTLDGTTFGGQFGGSISLSRDGTRMAVADASAVFIYDLVDQVESEASSEDGAAFLDWELAATILAPENATMESANIPPDELVLGLVIVDLCADGTTIAVGWPYSRNTDGLLPGTGRVEVYQEPENGGNQWQRVGHTMYGRQRLDYFGAAVSLGETCGQVAVASPGNNGTAAVYTLLNQNVWVLVGDAIDMNGDLAVTSVSFSRNTLALAGKLTSQNNGSSISPVARIFRFVDLNWIELGSGLLGAFESTAYLVELARAGNVVAISNYYTEPHEGLQNDALDVRAFEWDGSEWIQLGDDLHAFAPGEKFGYFISLSDDGRRLGMGDPGRRSEGGSVAGHIHVYEFDEAKQLWQQVGPNRDGDSPGDQFGRAVALSGDGRHLAAGAPLNRGAGVELGRVYVFDINFDDVRVSSSSSD